MFDPEVFDRRARAKLAAEKKAFLEVLPFEFENAALGREQNRNRWARPIGDLPAPIVTSEEGSWINSRHNPDN